MEYDFTSPPGELPMPPGELPFESLPETVFPTLLWVMAGARLSPDQVGRLMSALRMISFQALANIELGKVSISWHAFALQLINWAGAVQPAETAILLLRDFFRLQPLTAPKQFVDYATKLYKYDPILVLAKRHCEQGAKINQESKALNAMHWRQHVLILLEQAKTWTEKKRHVDLMEQWYHRSSMIALPSRITLIPSLQDRLDAVCETSNALKRISGMRRKRRREGGEDMEVPSEFSCPISHEIMQDPVCLPCGHTFERESIEQWSDSQRSSARIAHRGSIPPGWQCPICRAWLWPGSWREDVSMSRLIRWWQRDTRLWENAERGRCRPAPPRTRARSSADP